MPPTRKQLASRKALWSGLEMVVIDTETTGLVGDVRIVSIALLGVSGGKVVVSSSWLVNPGTTRIGATHIHGLTAADLQDQPGFAQLADVIRTHLHSDQPGGVVLTGHNVSFDAACLAREFARTRLPCPPLRLLDTAALAKAAHVAPVSGKLDALLDALGMSNPAKHTALGDALLTAAASIELIGRLADRGVTTVENLLVPFDAKQARLQLLERELVELTPEHQAAHDADLTTPGVGWRRSLSASSRTVLTWPAVSRTVCRPAPTPARSSSGPSGRRFAPRWTGAW